MPGNVKDRGPGKRSSNTNCCIVGCTNTYLKTNANIKFYNFPKRPWLNDQREKWISAVKRKRYHERSRVKVEKPSLATSADEVTPMEIDAGILICEDTCSIENSTQIFEMSTQTPLDFDMGPEVGPSLIFCSRDGLSVGIQTSLPYTREVETSKDVTILKNSSSGDCQPTLFFNGYKSLQHASDKNEAFSSLCGLSPNVFALLLNLVKVGNSRQNEINIENKLVLFLMKLKLGVTFSALAIISGLHRSTISRCFFKILDCLHEHMKHWIFWPSKTAIKKTMPQSFKLLYPECRAIIDCTEIKTEKPPTVEQQNFLYSNYKSGYTLKYFISIAPNGMVTFLSSGYGGRSSDCYITTDSGFLNKLEPGDVILADKGFPSISIDAKRKHSVIVMPPFAHDKMPFSEKEMKETYSVATVRIHVERLIQRIKTFNILNNRITVQMLPHMDKVMVVCASLSNLQNPIIKNYDC